MPKTMVIRVCCVCGNPDETQDFSRDKVKVFAEWVMLPSSGDGEDDPLHRHYAHPRCLGMKRSAA